MCSRWSTAPVQTHAGNMMHSQSVVGGCGFESGSSSGSASSAPTAKSTKGASKMRRDMINGEISVLRDLLPLPSSTRQRLSQLQLMALVCVYVRKANYFDQVFKLLGKSLPYAEMASFGFSKALNGFLMVTTQTGKLIYISDNAAEYLGHSMEDLLIHGDSVYDIIDKQDHGAIQTELLRGNAAAAAANGVANGNNGVKTDKAIFLCRMNVSRNSRRQMRFGDQKVVLIEGRFSGLLPLCSRNEPVFVSWCTPVAMPESRESIVQGATNIFTATHDMALKCTAVDQNGEFYLGYRRYDLKGMSLYSLLHPDYVREVEAKHRLLTQSESEKSCILLVRLQRRDGSWLWCHCVMQVKEPTDANSQQQHIVCTNQILSEEEARILRANSWLYHYYMVQSRLQYSLAYGGAGNGAATPTGLGMGVGPHSDQQAAFASLYPHMMGVHPSPHPPFGPAAHQHFDEYQYHLHGHHAFNQIDYGGYASAPHHHMQPHLAAEDAGFGAARRLSPGGRGFDEEDGDDEDDDDEEDEDEDRSCGSRPAKRRRRRGRDDRDDDVSDSNNNAAAADEQYHAK